MCDDQTKSVEDAVGVASKRVSEPTVRLLKNCCFIICCNRNVTGSLLPGPKDTPAIPNKIPSYCALLMFPNDCRNLLSLIDAE